MSEAATTAPTSSSDATTAPAMTGSTTPAADALRSVLPYIERWLAYRAWKARVPGVQVAVYFDGDIQLSRAFGLADVEAGIPLTPNHLFRIASHSKTFTATAILQLFEQGKLRLDDTAGTFVPALSAAGSPIAAVTVRELLGHGGGILRDGLDGDYWQHSFDFPNEAELLEILLDRGQKFEAGESFNYSNIGYSLLGLIIAAASGQSYNDYVAESIVAKLALANTGPEWDPARATEYAAGYTGFHTALTRRPVGHVDTRAMAAATGFYGTADDLVRYASAHFFGDERLLSDVSKRLQQKEEWASDPSNSHAPSYGLGMIIDRIGGHRVVGHSGGYPGHITRTLFDPVEKLAVSVMTNAVDGPASELSAGVLRLLDAALERTSSMSLSADSARDQSTASDGTVVAFDSSSERFVGRYANMWGVMDIVQLGQRLVCIYPGAADPVDSLEDLEVTGHNTLKIVAGSGFGSVGETILFEFAPDGSVASVRGGGGMSMKPFADTELAD